MSGYYYIYNKRVELIFYLSLSNDLSPWHNYTVTVKVLFPELIELTLKFYLFFTRNNKGRDQLVQDIAYQYRLTSMQYFMPLHKMMRLSHSSEEELGSVSRPVTSTDIWSRDKL